MIALDEAAHRPFQQVPTPALAHLVARAVTDDGAGDGRGQHGGQADAVLEGKHATEEHADLTGEEEAREGRGLQGGEGEDDGQGGPAP